MVTKRKHEIRDEEAEMAEEIERIDRGEDAYVASEERLEIEFKRPLDKVIPVRLAADKWDELYREARELGIGPSTLLRMWTLEKLRSLKRRRSRPA